MRVGSFSSLKVTDWPVHDQSLWVAGRKPSNFWEQEGRAADWRPSTIVSVEYHYGTFLWWLKTAGRLCPSDRPSDRVTPENLNDFVEAYTVAHALSSVAAVVRVVGDMVRVTDPQIDVRWLYKMALRIKRRATPVKPLANRRRPTIDLTRLGEILTERGRALLEHKPDAGAMMFRDGLMISAATNLPLRRHNFSLLRIGVSLIRHEVRYGVEFLGDDMKNGQAFAGWYPEHLTAAIDFYIDHFRPTLRTHAVGPDIGWFWLGRRGEPLPGATISIRVRELTRRHLGFPLSLHSFRHSAATDIALLDPVHVGIIRSVLGHSNELSTRFYDLASTADAMTKYQALLADLRKRDRES